ncbi:MAG TPA: hypothetical protein VGN72_09575 [Tepidisphaeraceae bacterium]|jgi:hypothetical protein|nr:hypothetical protein [Tepidisphaeraceae bacterium]
MARTKQSVNFAVQRHLADRFRDSTKEYYGKLGLCFSACMLMWLEADPAVQAEYLKRVFGAEIDEEMAAVIEQAKAEQLRRIKTREESPKSRKGS